MNTLQDRIERLSPTKRGLLNWHLEDLCAGMSRETESGDEQLVAYLVCDTEDEDTVDVLREALRAALPSYTIPRAFLLMDALPRTTTGKIDKQALPAPGELTHHQAPELIAPRNEAERTLAKIWAEVLGSEEIGVHDNFFELGGNSLLVNRVVSRARETFDIELALRDLFEAPTIARFAELVEQTLIAELESMPEPSPPDSDHPSGP